MNITRVPGGGSGAPAPDSNDRYQVCSTAVNGVSVMELAVMAEYAYYVDNPSVVGTTATPGPLFNQRFDSAVWQQTLSSPNSAVAYVLFQNRLRNLVVVATRGTKTKEDVFEDVTLFAEIGLLRLFPIIIPFEALLAVNSTATVVDRMSRLRMFSALSQNRLYYKELATVVSQLAPGTELIITGHSLGGALSMIVAAMQTPPAPAVVFNSPGIAYSSIKFGLPAPSVLYRDNLMVRVESDPINYIDLPAGEVQQYVNCFASAAPQAGFCAATLTGCHALVRTIYELWDGCVGYHAQYIMAPARPAC